MTRRPFKNTGQWSEELFVVSEKLRTILTTYRVNDLVDEQIDGTFYHQELQWYEWNKTLFTQWNVY